ncbi:MAG TPA: hypothetical protein VHB20_01995 [Verrucomicrobiae bacterium]|nr:hypothetical protein [Verrucomicrobiae bacterium]
MKDGGLGRKGLRLALASYMSARQDGIDFGSANRWVVVDLRDPIAFFRHLSLLIPPDSILCFEGCAVASETGELYRGYAAENPARVTPDIIWPKPQSFHTVVLSDFLDRLGAQLEQRAASECFDHLKAYRGKSLLFHFHDAFDCSPLLVADSVAESSLSAFAAALHASYHSESRVKASEGDLTRVLAALENAPQLRANASWWRKLLSFWKR